MRFLIQSPSPDGIRKSFTLRSLRLSGKPDKVPMDETVIFPGEMFSSDLLVTVNHRYATQLTPVKPPVPMGKKQSRTKKSASGHLWRISTNEKRRQWPIKESIVKQTYYSENLPTPLFAKEG